LALADIDGDGLKREFGLREPASLSPCEGRNYRTFFEWTLGKKSPVLKRVDKAAKAAARRGGPDIDRGYKPGAIARSMVKGAASRFPASGQLAIIRPYRKNLLGRVKRRFVSIFSAKNRKSTLKAVTRLRQLLLQQNSIDSTDTRVRFNENPKYPQILEIVEEVPLPKPVATDERSNPA
jgi:hypothetical protein